MSDAAKPATAPELKQGFSTSTNILSPNYNPPAPVYSPGGVSSATSGFNQGNEAGQGSNFIGISYGGHSENIVSGGHSKNIVRNASGGVSSGGGANPPTPPPIPEKVPTYESNLKQTQQYVNEQAYQKFQLERAQWSGDSGGKYPGEFDSWIKQHPEYSNTYINDKGYGISIAPSIVNDAASKNMSIAPSIVASNQAKIAGLNQQKLFEQQINPIGNNGNTMNANTYGNFVLPISNNPPAFLNSNMTVVSNIGLGGYNPGEQFMYPRQKNLSETIDIPLGNVYNGIFPKTYATWNANTDKSVTTQLESSIGTHLFPLEQEKYAAAGSGGAMGASFTYAAASFFAGAVLDPAKFLIKQGELFVMGNPLSDVIAGAKYAINYPVLYGSEVIASAGANPARFVGQLYGFKQLFDVGGKVLKPITIPLKNSALKWFSEQLEGYKAIGDISFGGGSYKGISILDANSDFSYGYSVNDFLKELEGQNVAVTHATNKLQPGMFVNDELVIKSSIKLDEFGNPIMSDLGGVGGHRLANLEGNMYFAPESSAPNIVYANTNFYLKTAQGNMMLINRVGYVIEPGIAQAYTGYLWGTAYSNVEFSFFKPRNNIFFGIGEVGKSLGGGSELLESIRLNTVSKGGKLFVSPENIWGVSKEYQLVGIAEKTKLVMKNREPDTILEFYKMGSKGAQKFNLNVPVIEGMDISKAVSTNRVDLFAKEVGFMSGEEGFTLLKQPLSKPFKNPTNTFTKWWNDISPDYQLRKVYTQEVLFKENVLSPVFKDSQGNLLELKDIINKDTITLYHGTDVASAESILAEGFNKKSYFTTDASQALDYVPEGRASVVLRVNVDKNVFNNMRQVGTTKYQSSQIITPKNKPIVVNNLIDTNVIQDNALLRLSGRNEANFGISSPDKLFGESNIVSSKSLSTSTRFVSASDIFGAVAPGIFFSNLSSNKSASSSLGLFSSNAFVPSSNNSSSTPINSFSKIFASSSPNLLSSNSFGSNISSSNILSSKTISSTSSGSIPSYAPSYNPISSSGSSTSGSGMPPFTSPSLLRMPREYSRKKRINVKSRKYKIGFGSGDLFVLPDLQAVELTERKIYSRTGMFGKAVAPKLTPRLAEESLMIFKGYSMPGFIPSRQMQVKNFRNPRSRGFGGL